MLGWSDRPDNSYDSIRGDIADCHHLFYIRQEKLNESEVENGTVFFSTNEFVYREIHTPLN